MKIYFLDGTELEGTTGSLLCQSLVKAYDSVALKASDGAYTNKVMVINALKSLLALDASAKLTALEGIYNYNVAFKYYVVLAMGLYDYISTTIDYHLYTHMNMLL